MTTKAGPKFFDETSAHQITENSLIPASFIFARSCFPVIVNEINARQVNRQLILGRFSLFPALA